MACLVLLVVPRPGQPYLLDRGSVRSPLPESSAPAPLGFSPAWWQEVCARRLQQHSVQGHALLPVANEEVSLTWSFQSLEVPCQVPRLGERLLQQLLLVEHQHRFYLCAGLAQLHCRAQHLRESLPHSCVSSCLESLPSQGHQPARMYLFCPPLPATQGGVESQAGTRRCFPRGAHQGPRPSP